MDPVLISLISACTALVASIAGPIVTLSVARRQFNATVLSANRQRWMEGLRDLLAELLALLVSALVVKSRWQGPWDKGMGPIAQNPDLMEKLARIVLLQRKVRLMLNPDKPEHQALIAALNQAFAHVQAEELCPERSEADIETVTRLAQTILQQEWGRVKRAV